MRRTVILLLSGLACIGMPMAGARARPLPMQRAPSPDPYAAQIAEASRRFGIPVAWIRAVMHHESRGVPRAVSPKGAMGLMQVMPATWAALRDRHALGADPFDPRDNILAGTAFLRELHDRYGSVGAMLAAYSAGPGRYEASLGGRPLPAETRAYVAAIAPTIDGDATVTPVRIASADPLAWIRAPLFAVQPDRTPIVDSVPAGRPSDDVPAALIVHDLSAIAPRYGGLFVARTGGDAR